MSNQKFTKGKWFVGTKKDFFGNLGLAINAQAGKRGKTTNIALMTRWGGIITEEEYYSDAALLASAKLLYENEQKNLDVIKTILEVYKEMQYLFENDSDVQAVLHNLPEDTFLLIIDKLKTRITITENLLTLARGEK